MFVMIREEAKDRYDLKVLQDPHKIKTFKNLILSLVTRSWKVESKYIEAVFQGKNFLKRIRMFFKIVQDELKFM